MEYGRIPASQFDSFDCSLPEDPNANNLVLKGQRVPHKFYLGCPQWGRKEWRGQIYPENTKDAAFQDEYMKQYNAIEFNATHYNLQGVERIHKWVSKAAGKDFKFCPKVWNAISHYSNFENTDLITGQFLNEMHEFGENLGPLFLQVSEKYAPKHKDKFFSYLKSLPHDMLLFVEVRHPDWYENNKLFEVLRELRIGAVITDTPAHRDTVHMQLTIPKAFIRLQLIGDHPTDNTRIDDWAQRLKHWLDKGLEEVYFFVHVHNEGLTPSLTKYAQKTFNKVCDAKLPEIKILQPKLF